MQINLFTLLYFVCDFEVNPLLKRFVIFAIKLIDILDEHAKDKNSKRMKSLINRKFLGCSFLFPSRDRN